MTPGRDGGRRPSGLSRRQLLTGIGGVGAVGMVGGLGTGAYLSDRATFGGNALGAGGVELTVDGAVTGGVVQIGVSGIEPGDAGTERFEVGVRTNPVRVWLAADCPEPGDDLAHALEVDVSVDGVPVPGGRGTLADVQRALIDGERIDVGCLGPAPEDALDVAVGWRLPDDAVAELAGTDAALAFRLYAEQCRHVSEADVAASNPFADRVCEGPECIPCADENGVKIGSLTLRYLGAEPANVVVAATGGGAAGTGNGGTVVFDETVGPDEAFVVDGSASPTNGDPDWIGPNIYVDDGSGDSDQAVSGVNIHTSCSVPIGPGDVYGDFEVVAATTTRGEPLCGADGGGEDVPVNGPDADPECGVCADGEGSLLSLDVRYLGGAPASLTAVSTKGGTSGTLYEGTTRPGDVFTLDGSDVVRNGNGGPGDRLGPEVEIAVDGGSTTAIHTSCSQPIAVGLRFGDGGLFEIAGGTTTGGEPLCGSEEN